MASLTLDSTSSQVSFWPSAIPLIRTLFLLDWYSRYSAFSSCWTRSEFNWSISSLASSSSGAKGWSSWMSYWEISKIALRELTDSTTSSTRAMSDFITESNSPRIFANGFLDSGLCGLDQSFRASILMWGKGRSELPFHTPGGTVLA